MAEPNSHNSLPNITCSTLNGNVPKRRTSSFGIGLNRFNSSPLINLDSPSVGNILAPEEEIEFSDRSNIDNVSSNSNSSCNIEFLLSPEDNDRHYFSQTYNICEVRASSRSVLTPESVWDSSRFLVQEEADRISIDSVTNSVFTDSSASSQEYAMHMEGEENSSSNGSSACPPLSSHETSQEHLEEELAQGSDSFSNVSLSTPPPTAIQEPVDCLEYSVSSEHENVNLLSPGPTPTDLSSSAKEEPVNNTNVDQVASFDLVNFENDYLPINDLEAPLAPGLSSALSSASASPINNEHIDPEASSENGDLASINSKSSFLGPIVSLLDSPIPPSDPSSPLPDVIKPEHATPVPSPSKIANLEYQRVSNSLPAKSVVEEIASENEKVSSPKDISNIILRSKEQESENLESVASPAKSIEEEDFNSSWALEVENEIQERLSFGQCFNQTPGEPTSSPLARDKLISDLQTLHTSLSEAITPLDQDHNVPENINEVLFTSSIDVIESFKMDLRVLKYAKSTPNDKATVISIVLDLMSLNAGFVQFDFLKSTSSQVLWTLSHPHYEGCPTYQDLTGFPAEYSWRTLGFLSVLISNHVDYLPMATLQQLLDEYDLLRVIREKFPAQAIAEFLENVKYYPVRKRVINKMPESIFLSTFLRLLKDIITYGLDLNEKYDACMDGAN